MREWINEWINGQCTLSIYYSLYTHLDLTTDVVYGCFWNKDIGSEHKESEIKHLLLGISNSFESIWEGSIEEVILEKAPS